MSDLIDRKAAIDAIRKDMYADKDYMSALICDGIEDVLKSLPSAQPMMTNAADLINRGDAILAVYKRIKQLGMENDVDVLSIRQSIRDLASAQPYTEEQIQTMQDLESAEIEKAYELGRESAQQEIIRCVDCKKYDMHDHRCKHWNHGVAVADWCSHAERGDEEDGNQS